MTAWESTLAALEVCTKPNPASVCTPHQAEALKMHECGADFRTIARHFGISPAAAEQLVERAHTRIKAFELFRSGMSPRKVAEELEISYQGVVQLLKPHQGEGRAKNENPR